MARSDALVVVLAGGEGSRLGLLTERRAKPAVPFAGSHRLVDFPLSNARNAGIDDVWLVQQYNPASLTEHVSNGRPWDLDRTDGGFRIVHPALGDDVREGFHEGTADALWRIAPMVREHDPGVLVVVSADAVYALDYEVVADGHRGADADVTIVTTRVDDLDPSRFGVVEADDGRVTGYERKPDEPSSDLVAIEVFVFTPGPVLELLEELADAADDDGLGDVGDGLLPRLVDAGRAREHRFSDYWRDVGTVEAYWQTHQDLLDDPSPVDLDDPAWPIASDNPHARSAARLGPSAVVSRSLLGPGSAVDGEVTGSVLGAGCVVEEGARVVGSVLLPGVVVRAGAHVERTVVDSGTEVAAARLGGPDEVTLVGEDVPEDATVEAGGQWPEEEGGEEDRSGA